MVRAFSAKLKRAGAALMNAVVRSLPRELVYQCGVRILAEVTARPDLSHVGREIHQGEVRMLWALDTFINRRPE